MEQQVRVSSPNQRQLADRRRHATSLKTALRLRGRRKGFRRAGEGVNVYVDCVAPRVIALVIGVLVCSALDAFLTGLYIERGGSEANPFMALMLIYGYTTFVSVKMALTGTGAWFLAVHQQFPLALHALYGLAFFYLALLAYHMVLAVGFTLE